MTEQGSPHHLIQARSERERFLIELLDILWDRYRKRMVYVRQFEAILRSYGTAFLNDHIAFRTVALQKPLGGIFHVSRIFESLGYVPAACYEFPDKNLSSIHYQHPNPQFPKIFITQLKSWELTPKNQRVLSQVFKSHRPPLPGAV
ncbi:MAG: DUF1338 family protein, partial [Elusimicrobia bacterium]|nr:DUF1338 family protein [Elusimicrobiota bacterium]